MFWRQWERNPVNTDAMDVDEDAHMKEDKAIVPRRINRERAVVRGSSYTSTHMRSHPLNATASASTSQSSICARTTRATCLVSTATSTLSTQIVDFTSVPKKTVRSEAESRHALESDSCALKVAPHDVLCAGCHRVIKLDRRSRYYPGLIQI
ncbi:hypothetical protein B0H14DRAFT_3442913 [Mycena olivaceomarginata]|nr:hypothetical protein B0H14DRAFT_3442913 [Mycena olivaceomarginata]